MRKFTLIVVIMISGYLLRAQDIHYSQFYASPLTLNPALTGVNECNYRVAAMYRNQWKSVTTPYVTPSISFDINNLLQRYVKTGTLSAGLLLLNDKAGDGGLSNTTIQGSVGYQHTLNTAQTWLGSIGVQFGYTQRSLDFTKLTWESQFDGTQFDPNQGPVITGDNFGYFDINIGGYTAYKINEEVDIFLGGAMFHLLTPKEIFLTATSENDLNMRGIVHIGARYAVNEKLNLIPQFLYMGQTKARELNPGLHVSYALNSDVNLYGGVYYRVSDAIIPMVALEYKKIRFGLSYDVNTSSLNEASNGKGGIELSLGYVGCIGGFIYDKPIMFCPRY